MYQRIRDLREDNDFTQKFVAEKLSFSSTIMQRLREVR